MFVAKRTALKSEDRSPRAERRPKSEIRIPKLDAERDSGFGLRASAFGFDPRLVVAINMALLTEIFPSPPPNAA